ncbi:MAG TPA: phenylacetate-CoA oxygenase subunit PaaC [Bacteroidia bacterium]|nr:phenylacetate-CoA oxygenase subunit PaaC [Bacteroidia bacterium]
MNASQNNQLITYCLRLGDSSLVLGQRLGEWCGHGPILEEDIALTNISLDLIGQARAFYTYAAQIENKGRSEDDFAFLRDERTYFNLLLTEQPNGDFGQTILRQFLVSAFFVQFYSQLKNSKDSTLASLADKSLKEVTYHLRHSSEWVLRLGDGTEESHQRLVQALDELWNFTGDLFDMDELDAALIQAGIAVDLNSLRHPWMKTVKEVFQGAKLQVPENTYMIQGSRKGKHTEHLGHLLTEMQALPRAFPGAQW